MEYKTHSLKSLLLIYGMIVMSVALKSFSSNARALLVTEDNELIVT